MSIERGLSGLYGSLASDSWEGLCFPTLDSLSIWSDTLRFVALDLMFLEPALSTCLSEQVLLGVFELDLLFDLEA